MILSKRINSKTIVWLENQNQYLIVSPIFAKILQMVAEKKSTEEITSCITSAVDITDEHRRVLLLHCKNLLFTPKKIQAKITNEHPRIQSYTTSKYYKINDTILLVAFCSAYETALIHPKFAHLEVEPTSKTDFQYQIFTSNDIIHLYNNTELIDVWHQKDSHVFQGKFSMKIIEHMHDYKEDKWMGILHASAVSNHRECILFLGASGNGKSTSLALLQAHGYTCLADDFVPILAKNKEVYSYPSAISIKKNSLLVLLPYYPELQNSAEYKYEKLGKTVRYLPPRNRDYKQHAPCNKLVFIKYSKNTDARIKEISLFDALEQLVPDSWLSPKASNAAAFLDWFTGLTCYQLTYSNNQKMIAIVENIFTYEL
ncbi:hypothetical protein BSU00_10040 [Tenacibaculum sp. SG-28]|nr:hypothetical protein BSU00_10040 [Tenacibaculum sp. SG-28]